jgi:phosphate starvation-inducible PhoH-like protein
LNELKLSIENVNPAVLWGPNNDHFEIIKKQYPKLKIVARGSEVKILGDDNESIFFRKSLQHLINHVEKYENLNITDLERILGSRASNATPGTEAWSRPLINLQAAR